MRKRERQQLVETLIRQRRLATQEDLAAALKKLGCQVTQATISRDLRDLGVQKGTDRNGKARFIVPSPRERRDPQETLARILRESEAEWLDAQNLVVVRSEPGTAPTVGRVIDELKHPDVIGTVAGDDTVLLVLGDASQARKMVKLMTAIVAEQAEKQI